MQDHGRALVIGEPTFGKGSVQTLMRLRPLTKECAIKLTTAKWYIASGRAIEKPERWKGVADGGAPADTMEVQRPEYRTAAGRTVYGGGGVTPDITIEARRRPDLLVDLERREEFFEFAIEYAAATEIPDGPIQVDDGMWDAFVDFLGRDEFEFDVEELEAYRDEVELAIRRDMTRRLRSREDAYVVALQGDSQVMEAARLAREASTLDDLFEMAEARADATEG